uniref:ARAD1C30734p n=1 Tax=Blastobotrys adeninivorans TaxID=409370 RepID=A0A060T2S5_BLAAD
MSQFEVRLLGPPNEDIVRGFPGISASWPRLEGVVEIRTKDETVPLQIAMVNLALYRTDVIHPPSNKPGISGPRTDQSFRMGDEVRLFQVSAGRSYDEVMSMDLPFIIPLPTNRPLPPSISLGKSTVETKYQLFVSIVYGKQQQYHEGFPVRIKRYDTLSTFGAYKVPVVNTVPSLDHLVGFDYSLPISAYGPGDLIIAYIKIYPNIDWQKSKKVKLQRVTMQVIEVTTYNPDGEESVEKRRRLCKVAQQLDMKLPEKGYQTEMSVDFPSIDLREKDNLIPKQRQDIPVVGRNGFTTASKLYKIEYILVLKARFSHCKDIEIEQPITVSQFDHATCMSFMRSISEAVEYANSVDRNRVPAPRIRRDRPSRAILVG